jgi:hypothetical protein
MMLDILPETPRPPDLRCPPKRGRPTVGWALVCEVAVRSAPKFHTENPAGVGV